MYRVELPGLCHKIIDADYETACKFLNSIGIDIESYRRGIFSFHNDEPDLILDESGKVVYDKDSMMCKESYKTWANQIKIEEDHRRRHRNLIYHGYFSPYNQHDGERPVAGVTGAAFSWPTSLSEGSNDDPCVMVCQNYGSMSKLEALPLEPSLKLSNHSPDGFAWGYNGSGPAQLALAILLFEFGNPVLALERYQDFKTQIIAQFNKDDEWLLSGEFVRYWVQNNTLQD